MKDLKEEIQKRLEELADPAYKAFHCKLIPTVSGESVMGVRTPVLRKFARTLAGQPEGETFLQLLPHTYYEENNLHGFLLETIKDYQRCIEELDRFLPFVDNWATCDMMSPKVLKKEPQKTLSKAGEWTRSNEVYVCRFGIKVLMDSYLEENFSEEILKLVAAVQSEEYYVRMMQAWFFATALAKQKDAALPYLQEQRLSVWVHNKTIQKARESCRISPQEKEELKKLKR